MVRSYGNKWFWGLTVCSIVLEQVLIYVMAVGISAQNNSNRH